MESATETADYRESGERSVMNCVNKMEIVYLTGSCNIVFIRGKSGRPIPEQKRRKTIILDSHTTPYSTQYFKNVRTSPSISSKINDSRRVRCRRRLRLVDLVVVDGADRKLLGSKEGIEIFKRLEF